VPELETAANINSSGDQHTLRQSLSAADVLDVHVLTHLTASEDEGMQAMAWAWMRSNVPGLARTALRDAGTPMTDVMTRLPEPVHATATKMDSSGDQHTPNQLLSAADVRVVHVMPLGLVMMRLPVPVHATATKMDSSGDQHTDLH
jgi:hypothetical protein